MKYEKIKDKTIAKAIKVCDKLKEVSLPMLQYKLKLTFDEANMCLYELLIAGVIDEQGCDEKYNVIVKEERKDPEYWLQVKTDELIDSLSDEEKNFCSEILPLAPFEMNKLHSKMREYKNYNKILYHLHHHGIIEIQNNEVIISMPENYFVRFMHSLNDLSEKTEEEDDFIFNDFGEDAECPQHTDFFKIGHKKTEIEENGDKGKRNYVNNDNLQLSIFDDEKELLNANIVELLKGKIKIITDDLRSNRIEFFRGKDKINVLFMRENDKILLSDLGSTMKYMLEKYELDAKDVKDCINNVMKHYEVSAEITENGNELKKVIESKDDCLNKLLQFYDCMTVLKDMFLFFDKPND